MLVSVIIPTYNRAAYVTQAVESVFGQTFRDFEIIVVDDGSTDGTREALKRYVDRIQYIYQENQGAAVARNAAINASRGELIALLDSDDIWMPQKLAVQIDFLRSHPEFRLVASHAIQLDKEGMPLGEAPLFPLEAEGKVAIENILLNSPLIASSIIVKRECLPAPLPFTPGIWFCEDWEMCLRVAILHPVGFIAQSLVGFRRHDNNLTHPVPAQGQVNLRLKNRLRVIERIFPLLTGNLEYLQPLRPRVEAVDCVQAAVASYANQNFDIAAQLLSKAIHGDPERWQGAEFARLLVDYAHIVLEKDGSEAALLFLRDTFSHLPSQFENVNSLCRKIFAHVHVAIAFQNYQRREMSQVAMHAVRGILHDLSWIKNRGVVSILIESFLGSSPTEILRRFSRRFFKPRARNAAILRKQY